MSQKLDVHYGSLIPEEWELRSVLSLGSFIQGTGFPEKLQGLKDEHYPFFKVSDFTLHRNHKHLKDSSNSISSVTLERLGAKVIPSQSIVFAKVGAALLLNRRRITIKKSIVDNNCAAIVPAQNIDLEFLYQTLLNIDFKNYVQDGAVPSINQHILGGILVPIPKSLSEQKKIASILQNVDNVIDQTRELIEKYEKMKQGLMQDLLKSENSTVLGNLIAFEYGVGLPEHRRSGEGYPVFGSNGVVGYHNKPLVHESGIIVGRKGTAGAVTFSERPFWAIDTAYYVRFKREMDKRFFFYLLSSLGLGKLEASTGVPGLNRNDAYKRQVPDLPVEEQVRVSKILWSIDKRIDSERSYLDKLTKIKTGLMQVLLTGRVRVLS